MHVMLLPVLLSLVSSGPRHRLFASETEAAVKDVRADDRASLAESYAREKQERRLECLAVTAIEVK
jgi:hypothetical protein